MKSQELERLVGNKMTNYPVGDFLIRVKNAAMAGGKDVEFASTKLVVAVAKVLEKSGYLTSITNSKGVLKGSLTIKHKEPVLMDVKLVSKPGLRVYKNLDELKDKKGASMYIVSTPKGVMTTKEAIKVGLGGEVIAEIW